MPFALVGNLDKSVASHVLNTFMRFVHELEKLVDNRLQELPVCFQESRILSDNVHDITRNDCLVVFATLLLSQTKKILDDRD